MPNWCYQKLAVTGPAASISEFKTRYMPGGKLSLNAIVPMPESLDVADASYGHWGYKAQYGNWEELLSHPRFYGAPLSATLSREDFLVWLRTTSVDRECRDAMLRDGKTYRANELAYGHRTWHGWRVEHWGTKWEIAENDQKLLVDEPGSIEIEFQTAWSPITPALMLASMNDSGLVFELDYLDEGGGFAGHWHLSDTHIEDTSRDWKGFAADVFGWAFEDEKEEGVQ